jgi:hypothetical protein
MQVLGTVISVSLETQVKKNGGGTYPGWELVYKTKDGEIRTAAKHVNDLKYKPNLKSDLQALSVGDQFTLDQEKNATSGFYDINSIKKGWGEGDPQVPAQAPAEKLPTSNNKSGNSYNSSSYPTAEERAATQQYIIRQSSLTNAVATLAVGAKAVNPDDVIKLAERYRNYVNGTEVSVEQVVRKAKGKVGVEAIEDMADDIPY